MEVLVSVLYLIYSRWNYVKQYNLTDASALLSLDTGMSCYTCHVQCDSNLIILFTNMWLNKCLVTKESVTCYNHLTCLIFSLIFGSLFFVLSYDVNSNIMIINPIRTRAVISLE